MKEGECISIVNRDIKELEKQLNVEFKNKNLLKQSLTHRSYLNENPKFRLGHNERLEFLGDAVLELVVTEYLYKNYDYPEGDLTNLRAALVNRNMLAEVAHDFHLEEYLLLSRGEAKDNGRARQYILANTFEALVGAIFLDKGLEIAIKFINKNLLCELPRVFKEKLYEDYKSKFQEESQEKVGVTPTYEVLDQWGPDHDKHFKVGVFLNDELVADGEGSSKQAAQQMSAHNALEKKGWG